MMSKKQLNRPKPCFIVRPRSCGKQRIFALAFNRRHLLQGGAIAAIAPSLGATPGFLAVSAAQAQTSPSEPAWRHALSLFGEVKHPSGFKRFDYVNPDAPKGGITRMISIGTFDNFNVAVAGIKGSLA